MSKKRTQSRLQEAKNARPRIMIVEDEFITADHLQKTLEDHGYEICAVVPSGKKAVEEAEALRPDLILMDIILKSELDGIEAARQIRTSNDIPVVFLTAYAHQSMLERAKGAEPYGYILKPFHGKELHTTIEMALHRHQTEMAGRRYVQRLDDALMSLCEGIIVTDVDGKVVFMNGAAESLTGWSRAEARGRPFSEVARLNEQPHGNTGMAPTGEAVDADGFSLADHKLLQAKEGSMITVDVSFSTLKDSKGKKNGMVATFKDMSNRKDPESSILRARLPQEE